MGFEIDNNEANNNSSGTIATSSKKIGTVTFIKKETGEFVALGHSTIKDVNKKTEIKGTCYDINFEGIKKGYREETGNIIACLDKNSPIGNIQYDSVCGIFGKINNVQNEYEEVETSCWYNVKKGKANILIALGEDELKSYEVEIIGIDYINKNKNIKVQITDPELLQRTGGVVQGMSGTPLMQERKINRSNKLC